MIKVCFPPGCYGTYVTQCVYNYTNLRNSPFVKFKFGSHGDSHGHRINDNAYSVIQSGHVDTLCRTEHDRVVVILPSIDHQLDYYNNQFFKQEHGHLIDYILTQMSVTEAEHKLKTCWGYIEPFDDKVPHWILREWCSFWIDNVLKESYNTIPYITLQSVHQLSTQDIFENFEESLKQIAQVLELTITVDQDIINTQHQEFLSLQKFHDSQIKCCQYVHDLLEGISCNMFLNSIFDQAYVQHLLRQQNLEIQCDGLNTFPTSTQDLRTLLYNS
jgi:hypothetical protein